MKKLYTDTGNGFLRSGLVRFHEALGPLMVPIDSVQPHPENNNNGDEDEVRSSVLINGMYRPIQVQATTRYILAGNTTWAAVKFLGATCIPIVPLAVDDIEALRIMLADNLIAAAAKMDDALTVEAANKIREATGDLEGAGITMEQLEVMEAKQAVPLEFDIDPYDGWPTLSAQVSPATFAAFMDMTEDADDDGNRGRLEYLMRMTGWQG